MTELYTLYLTHAGANPHGWALYRVERLTPKFAYLSIARAARAECMGFFPTKQAAALAARDLAMVGLGPHRVAYVRER